MSPNEWIVTHFASMSFHTTETSRVNFKLLTPCAIEPGKTTWKKVCYETR